MAYGNNKSHWKLKTLLFVVTVLASIYGLLSFFPSAQTAIKTDVINRLGLGQSSDNIVIISNDVSSEKITHVDNTIKVPITVTDNTTYLVVKVNGVDVNFVLDTGCSGVSITSAELYYLEHMGRINSKKVHSTATCVYADGSTGERNAYIIDSITIGGIRIDSVLCTVEDDVTTSPLLGQSVLSRLGTVAIDYGNKQLIIN